MPNVRRTGPRSARRTTSTRRVSTPPKRRPRRRTTRRRTTLRADRPFAQGMTLDRVARTLHIPPLGAPQAVSLLIFALVVTALVLAATQSAFYVYQENVRIEGAHYTPVSTIYQQAGVDSYHVFFIDPREVARRIEALPYIRRARVTVHLPALVHIQVEERVPILVWERGDGRFWVDEEGVALPALEDRPALMRLADPEALGKPSDEEEATSEVKHLDTSVLSAVLTIQKHLPDVRVVYYDSTHGLRIIVPTPQGSVEVILGPLTGLEERIVRLPAILAQVRSGQRRVTRIDLTRPEAVYWEE